MRIILIFILGILLHAPLHAQPKMDSSLVYIHHDKPSFKSQFFQKVASVFGVKNLIEKSIIKGKYDQEVAPIPKSVIKNSTVIEKVIGERRVWTIKPRTKISEKVILYLHGGAYHWNISKYNWSFVEKLMKKTNASFIVPDYPLAPHSTCEQVYKYVSELYQELILKYDPENIILLGESSGAGLALGFTMYLRDHNKPQPNQLILLAPWLDVTMNNQEILRIDKKDKILGIKGLQLAGEAYAGKLSTSDYKVSPINGDLSNLTQLSVFVGTHDLFVADARKLKDKAHSLNIPLKYYEYPKMFHVWILVEKLKEADHAINQIVSLILES